MTLPVVFSLSGLSVHDDEARLFEKAAPYGYILFKRNIDNPEQLGSLIADLKDISGLETNILIDQEGGRVQRLTTPHWQKYPCMNACQNAKDLKTTIASLSQDLSDVGININCAPVLDVLQTDTDNSIGDRAFSHDPEIVFKLGHVACQTFLDSRIVPIIKHLPGHGRAIVDSHEKLPEIHTDLENLRQSDFIPFQKIINETDYGDTLSGMVGHCLYRSIDNDKPASLSEKVIQDIIRREIGLKGMLFSDDLSMGALNQYGDLAERTKLCLDAGCDIALYCAGDLNEMKSIFHKLS